MFGVVFVEIPPLVIEQQGLVDRRQAIRDRELAALLKIGHGLVYLGPLIHTVKSAVLNHPDVQIV